MDKTILLTLVVPKPYTPSSLLSNEQSRKSVNKGVGRDRALSRILKSVIVNSDLGNNQNKTQEISWAMQCQNMAEEIDGDKEVSTSLDVACGLLLNLKMQE